MMTSFFVQINNTFVPPLSLLINYISDKFIPNVYEHLKDTLVS